MNNNKSIKILLIIGSFYSATNIRSESLNNAKQFISSNDSQKNISNSNHLKKYWKIYAIGGGIIAIIAGPAIKIIYNKNKEISKYQIDIQNLINEKQVLINDNKKLKESTKNVEKTYEVNLINEKPILDKDKEKLENENQSLTEANKILTNEKADLMMQSIQSNYKIDNFGKILKYEMEQYPDDILEKEMNNLQNKGSLDETEEIRLAFLQQEYQIRSQAN